MANHGPISALTHVGRKSGREFRIPLTPFRTDDGFLFALTYGSDTDWVKNVLAAGEATLEHDGNSYRLTNPLIESKTEAWGEVALVARPMLLALHVTEFLRMDSDPA